jgi:hypothetical protein
MKNTTLYVYELAWMLPSVALPVGMLAAFSSLRGVLIASIGALVDSVAW